MTTVPHTDTQSTQHTHVPMIVTSIDIGISAIITLLHSGKYSVATRNDDTMSVLPTLYIYPTYEQAYASALLITELC